jgi:hypothetical protein
MPAPSKRKAKKAIKFINDQLCESRQQGVYVLFNSKWFSVMRIVCLAGQSCPKPWLYEGDYGLRSPVVEEDHTSPDPDWEKNCDWPAPLSTTFKEMKYTSPTASSILFFHQPPWPQRFFCYIQGQNPPNRSGNERTKPYELPTWSALGVPQSHRPSFVNMVGSVNWSIASSGSRNESGPQNEKSVKMGPKGSENSEIRYHDPINFAQATMVANAGMMLQTKSLRQVDLPQRFCSLDQIPKRMHDQKKLIQLWQTDDGQISEMRHCSQNSSGYVFSKTWKSTELDIRMNSFVDEEQLYTFVPFCELEPKAFTPITQARWRKLWHQYVCRRCMNFFTPFPQITFLIADYIQVLEWEQAYDTWIQERLKLPKTQNTVN